MEGQTSTHPAQRYSTQARPEIQTYNTLAISDSFDTFSCANDVSSANDVCYDCDVVVGGVAVGDIVVDGACVVGVVFVEKKCIDRGTYESVTIFLGVFWYLFLSQGRCLH